MHHLRPLAPYLLTVSCLIAISVFTLVSIGESFATLALSLHQDVPRHHDQMEKRDAGGLRERGDSTIVFALPWRSARDFNTENGVKDVGPVGGGVEGELMTELMEGVTSLSGALPVGGSITTLLTSVAAAAPTVLGGASALSNGAAADVIALPTMLIATTIVSEVTTVASTVLGGENLESGLVSNAGVLTSMTVPTTAFSQTANPISVVASILNQVDSMVNEATSIIGTITGDGTSTVSNIGALNPFSSPGLPVVGINTSSISSPGLTDTQSNPSSTANNMFPSPVAPPNTASAASIPISQASTSSCSSSITNSLTASTSSCSSSITNSLTASTSATSATTSACSTTTLISHYPAVTETCTVTESWFITKYSSTATLFSFESLYTIISTETVRYVSSSLMMPAVELISSAYVRRSHPLLHLYRISPPLYRHQHVLTAFPSHPLPPALILQLPPRKNAAAK
jgi:hypothetical protein